VQTYEVWCLGRFTDPIIEEELRVQGMRTWRWDMARDGLDDLPEEGLRRTLRIHFPNLVDASSPA
jgi:hypothetical protein